MSSDSEPTFKRNPSRATRGLRMTDIHAVGDDDFWAQDFFADEDEESDYIESGQEASDVDDDFYDAEDESDEDINEEEDNKSRKRKKGAYVDPHAKRTLKRGKKVATVQTKTSEEILEEAKQTEIENSQSLKELLMQVEAKKQKSVRNVWKGPLVRFYTGVIGTTISFLDTRGGVVDPDALIPSIFKQTRLPNPEHPRCAITNKFASYIDPRTMQPYSNIAAFKALRSL